MLKEYTCREKHSSKSDTKLCPIWRHSKKPEHHAEFIALSALMTTTMQRMREIVAAAKEEGITAKIIIGGAVITQEYADEIGADGYSKDAADAVKLAKSLM